MQAARLATRLQRELRMLQTDPPPGACAWLCNDSLSHLEAQIQGPEETVYEKGIFKLEVRVPERYPFEPPNVRFSTPIYHPNIDSGGRICLDILNMPPKGAWKPSLNIPTLLASVGLLLAEPNPDDGLMGDIAAEYKHNRASFDAKARQWTQLYAMQTRLQDGAGQVTESGGQEVCMTKTTEAIAPSMSPHYPVGLGFSGERRQETDMEVIKKQGTGTGVRVPNTSNQRLNISMKLSRDKGGKVLERQSTSDTLPAAASAEIPKHPLACVDNNRAKGPATVQQDCTLSCSIDMAVREGSTAEHHTMAPASRLGDDSRRRGMGDDVVPTPSRASSYISCIDGVDTTTQVPSLSNKIAKASSADLTKFRDLQENTRCKVPCGIASAVVEQEAASVDKIELTRKVNSEAFSGRTKLENVRQLGTRSGENAASTTKSVRIDDVGRSKKHDSGSSEICLAGGPEENRRSLSVNTGIPKMRSGCMTGTQEVYELALNPAKLSSVETSQEMTGQPEVLHLSGGSVKRSRQIESNNIAAAESVKKLNPKVLSSDNIHGGHKSASKLSTRNTSIVVPGQLEDKESLVRELDKRSRHSSCTTSPRSTDVTKHKAKSVDGVQEAPARTTSFPGPASSTPVLRSVRAAEDLVLASVCGPPTFLGQDGEKAAERITRERDITKKAVEIDLAAVIVLDSESDDEPPKGRSRLSLAKRKGVKRK